MVAGPNGSGKSALIEKLRATGDLRLPAIYVNADNLKRERNLSDLDAQKLARWMRTDALARGQDVMFETVMSHPSRVAELQVAARSGYTITMIFVATHDVGINIDRVRRRVAAGGHPVPEKRVRERYARSLVLAPLAFHYADEGLVFDNSVEGDLAITPLIATLENHEFIRRAGELPAWTIELIEAFRSRAADYRIFHNAARNKSVSLRDADLSESRSEGKIAAIGEHYTLQIIGSSGAVLHERALLNSPVREGSSYRIEYADAVSKVKVIRGRAGHANLPLGRIPIRRGPSTRS